MYTIVVIGCRTGSYKKAQDISNPIYVRHCELVVMQTSLIIHSGFLPKSLVETIKPNYFLL